MTASNIKKTLRDHLPLLGLLLLALLTRLPSPDGASSYLMTELQRDLLALKELSAGRGIPLGPPCVHGGWHFPPAYHYLYLPLALLAGFRPYSLALTSLLFSLLTVVLAFHASKRWFGDAATAYLAAGLLAVSALDMTFAKYGSNPNTLPFFALLFFYQLEKFVAGRNRAADAPVLGLAFAVATQLHTVAFVSLPLVLVAALLLKKIGKIRAADAVWFSLTVLLLYSPYLYAQLTGHFSDLAGLLGVAGGTSTHGTFPNRFADTLSFWLALLVRFGSAFGDRLAAGIILLSVNIVLILLVWFLDGRRKRDVRPAPRRSPSVKTILILWLTVPHFVLLLPLGGIDILPVYYFTLLLPLGYLLMAWGISSLWRRGLRLTAGAFLASYILWQAVQIVQYHREFSSFLTSWIVK